VEQAKIAREERSGQVAHDVIFFDFNLRIGVSSFILWRPKSTGGVNRIQFRSQGAEAQEAVCAAGRL
jgi:hypothetical protein